MGHASTPRDLAAYLAETAAEPDIGQDGTALPTLEAHIRALVAARDGARRAITSARRNRPGQLRRHARELAHLARRLTVARRDRARLLRGRSLWPLLLVGNPARSLASRARRAA